MQGLNAPPIMAALPSRSTLPDNPELPVVLTAHETPPRFQQTCPPDLLTEKQRDVMLDNLQENVPLVEWTYFMDTLLPPLHPKINMETFMENLENVQGVVRRNGELRWTAFADGAPSTQKPNEDEVFKVLEKILQTTRASSLKNERMTTQLKCKPTIVPTSENRDNKAKPDGYFMLNDPDSSIKRRTPEWHDVVVPAEFKKNEDLDSANANARQILWSLDHLMREDPRRRFVFGFTIEDDHMRLWFASRSHVLASYTINFLTGIERVAEFFLRIMWAEKPDLGFDETVELLKTSGQDGGPQYNIEVNNKTYRTQRLISSAGADTLQGRGTRVWEVKEVDARGRVFGPSMVLKDAWVDYARDREAIILQKIRNSAKTPRHATAFDRYLLHVVEFGDVPSVNGSPDDTQTIICRGKPPEHKWRMRVLKDMKATSTTDAKLPPKKALIIEPEPAEKLIVYPRRVHHRVVFSEVGKTILEAETLPAAFEILKDILIVLGAMHACGWVHRDVSAGNVLVHEGIGKLADVEFAKAESDTGSHSVRTGTAFFMAVEVEDGRYHFMSSKDQREQISTIDEEEDSDDDGLLALMERRMKKPRLAFDSSGAPLSPPSRASSINSDDRGADLVADALPDPPKRRIAVSFRHNPLHDFESVLWLSWFIVLGTAFPQFDGTTEIQWAEYTLNRLNLSNRLFNNNKVRVLVMNADDNYFEAELEGLHPKVKCVCDYLDRFREQLADAYRKAEKDALQAVKQWEKKHDAALERDEQFNEVRPCGIPFNVGRKLCQRLVGLMDTITDSRANNLKVNGAAITFAPKSIMRADHLKERDELENTIRDHRVAQDGEPSSDAEIPETPRPASKKRGRSPVRTTARNRGMMSDIYVRY